ncbi:conserved exported hypothetical protein [Candidatus Sulfopaludibacter sp. SbA4]|nr:conserved exported hypothetical protein [Candidatus Sulfopaludibacter sp. SbA4]
MQQRLARLLLTLFIAFHVVAITLWVLPLNKSLTGFLHRWIGPYFSFTGLRQEWSLFAPDPLAADSYIDAHVVLQNGDLRIWDFPRLEGLDFKQRYSKARYRKFEGWLYRKNFAYAWPDTARYVARQFKASGVPPSTVTLVRHWARIPPIASAPDTSPSWRSTVLFVYQVSPEDLE